MAKSFPASIEELHAELSSIDQELRREHVSFPARAIQGWLRFSHKRGLGLSMSSRIENPSRDDLSYDALTAHIFDWFNARYGRKQNIIYAPSTGLMDIDGDFFAVKVSRIFGQIHVEINPERFAFKYKKLGKDRPPKANLLQDIDDLTQAYAVSISSDLYPDLIKQYGTIVWVYNLMMDCRDMPLVAEASVDVDAGVAALLDGISFGHARWCFHQAAEKSIKALLVSKNVAYPKTGHRLDVIRDLSGLLKRKIDDKVLSDASCCSKARYGEIRTTSEEALLSYRSALIIIKAAIEAIAPKRALFGIQLYPGPFPESAFDPLVDGTPADGN